MITPVPNDVAQMVNEYIYNELNQAEKYENRQPLDDSGKYSLHRLVANAYARGFNDGHAVATIERREL